ncbi:hypothetical protein GQX74_010985 [Glossina fuscipes]|nr:hypothetical protein GQX74_010985 [Glossina fuscipes]
MLSIVNIILVWCITAEILNVRLPVTTLLQMICHVNRRTGTFGLDRFVRLSYYGTGLLKASTLGGFFIVQLVDIILVALQIVRPANGSYYIIPCYGAVGKTIRSDNETYRVPKDDW